MILLREAGSRNEIRAWVDEEKSRMVLHYTKSW